MVHHTDHSVDQCDDDCTDPQSGQCGEEKKRLMAFWLSALATLRISAMNITLIHRVVTVAKKKLMAFCSPSTLLVSAVIAALIHRKRATHHSHATVDSVILSITQLSQLYFSFAIYTDEPLKLYSISFFI